MFCVVGLGNPGVRYARTRHNVGFEVVDEIARRTSTTFSERGFSSVALVFPDDSGVPEMVLVKPLTYMNLSGVGVVEVLREFRLEPKDLIVVHDDLDLPVGKIRLKRSGSSGGHKGVESIIQELGTNEFVRMKIGIGRPLPGVDVPDHVLTQFAPDERRVIDVSIQIAADAVSFVMRYGVDAAMNQYNGMPSVEER